MTINSKRQFYSLSFSWGIIVSLIGCAVSLVLILTGHKPKKWGYCWYFVVGKSWGGLEIGPCFLVDSSDDYHIKCHEFGHGIQNCYFGPLMLVIVTIPSIIRYWYRKIVPCKTKYDDIWFEGQATRIGTTTYESMEENNVGHTIK